MIRQAFWAQVGSDVETGLSSLASLASLQTVSEEEWHEEVVTLSPEQLVEATFKRLFPDSFLYALPVWEHKVRACLQPSHPELVLSLQGQIDANTDAIGHAVPCILKPGTSLLSSALLI